MRRGLSLCAIVVAIACGDATGPTPQSVSGTWNLQSVNGGSLPYTVLMTGSVTDQVTAGLLIVEPDRTFSYATTFRSTANGQSTTLTATDSGTYSLSGDSVSFLFRGDGTTGSGLLNGDTVSLNAEGFSLVYTKQ